jgi:hypothetical protein
MKAGVLKGIADISRFANRSYRTLLRLKQQYPGMPMTKDGDQGIWWADPERLRQFLRDVAAGQGQKWVTAPEPEPEPQGKSENKKANKGRG